MASVPLVHRRPALAEGYVDALEGRGILDARSGLFLAGPRRTGKSTFLREDMLPVLNSRQHAVVYVDLWSDRAALPASLIAAAIKKALAQYEGSIKKFAKGAGLDKVNVFGALSLNLNSLEMPPNVTLADALEALQMLAGHPVTIVVDEAQHALSSKEGIDAMFALKAARDHLNQGSAVGQKLYLIFTGSNQDKLSRLVRKKNQPFYGSSVSKFPLLDRGFSDAYTEHINSMLAQGNQFEKDDIWKAFQLVGQRPEMLRSITSEIALSSGVHDFKALLEDGAEAFREQIWGDMESEFNALSEMQQAVLVRLIDVGNTYEPFTEKSLAAYGNYAGRTVTTSEVQAALTALREKNLIWQAAYGDYALEDESMALWYKTMRKAKIT